jgi:ATP-binding cassette subfamily B protein
MELLTGRGGAKEVRVFGAAGFLRGRYDDLTDERLSRMREFLRGRLRVGLVGAVGTGLGMAIAMSSLAFLLSTGEIDVASALAAGGAMMLLSTRVTAMTGSVGRLIETGMFLDDYNAFLELGREKQEARSLHDAVHGDVKMPLGFTGLEVENVSFEYPGTDKRVLHDVSLRVEPGEIVALVGENGSGKTTLVKLICRLYQAQAGRVLWSGVDTAQLRPEQVTSDMTVIFQDFIQYHLTAADNIAVGRIDRDPSVEDLSAAARQAGAHGFLEGLPQGYETRLGRQFYGAHELSIGQWQRLALARAFFRGGSFLILDEPTASLDPRAEAELFDQMRALAAGRSVLLVSHRFSSVRAADRIYVLKEGRVAERGTHEELVERNGYYADLFALHRSSTLVDRAGV